MAQQRQNETPPRRRRKKGKLIRRWYAGWQTVMFVMGCCLAASVFMAFLGISIFGDLFGLNQRDRQAEIVLDSGMSQSQMVRQLKKADIIDYPTVFKLYAALSSDNTPFQPGSYLFNANMGYDEIIIAMRTRKSVSQTVSVTFYEGMSAREIAALLESESVCKAADFLSYLERATGDYEFLNMIPEDDGRFRRLEGYLFPDTYEFFVGQSVAQVVDKFLSNFDQKITDELYAKMLERNLTLDDAITLASIIEKECSDSAEAATVSSVFYNRMANAGAYPRLQSDVTIFYVNQDIKPYLEVQDQALYNRYNTYVCEGLPVGPICNPGIATIEAALAPANTEYYFFISDEKGVFHYAETYQEHLKNIAKASGKAQGTDTEIGGEYGD